MKFDADYYKHFAGIFSPTNPDRSFKICSIPIPGNTLNLKWELGNDGLGIYLPSGGLDERATVLKIETAN